MPPGCATKIFLRMWRDLHTLVLPDTLVARLAGSMTDEVIKIRQAMTAANASAGDTMGA
jgi:hypothetical protein